MKLPTLAALCVALLLIGCASRGGPGMPECSDADDLPKATKLVQAPDAKGGQQAGAKQSATDYGAPAATIQVPRGEGDALSASEYSADKPQAGTLAVNQAWDANATAIAEFTQNPPPGIVAAQTQIKLLQTRSAMLPPGSEQHAVLDKQIADLITAAGTINSDFFKGLAKLAPNYSNATLVQLVLAGSGVNQDAVDPENSAAAVIGVPAALEKIAKMKAALYEANGSEEETEEEGDGE